MKLDFILDAKGREVATIHPEVTVRELVDRLAQLRIGALVVSVDGSSVDGMVSERDVVRELAARGPEVLAERVQQIMTDVVQCAPPSAEAADVAALMTNRRVRHIPVIDDEARMIGLVSIGDVVKSRLDELQGERDALIDYVTR
jgi:CBS domain-containing protein